MWHDVLRRAAGCSAAAAVCVHLLATLIHGTPDSFNIDLRRYVGGWTIPGWRFFAPTPGVQNVHLLVRTGPESAPSDWRDITPAVSHRWTNMLINPRSRGPKALFDLMQQLSVLKGNYATWAFLISTLPYELIADASRGLLRGSSSSHFQFLLVNYFPALAPSQRVVPILVSEWLPLFSERTRD